MSEQEGDREQCESHSQAVCFTDVNNDPKNNIKRLETASALTPEHCCCVWGEGVVQVWFEVSFILAVTSTVFEERFRTVALRLQHRFC